ncbi:Hypothetical predicted protein [Octopus vulgaris]|uniref:Uncharacterized protein n=1 Tax=Octopus vulgaris TaxID=6645 RepID=A0AA36FD43_OCTVU|nr:Hypothetical predicted protein [Octopus vulgaris]
MRKKEKKKRIKEKEKEREKKKKRRKRKRKGRIGEEEKEKEGNELDNRGKRTQKKYLAIFGKNKYFAIFCNYFKMANKGAIIMFHKGTRTLSGKIENEERIENMNIEWPKFNDDTEVKMFRLNKS